MTDLQPTTNETELPPEDSEPSVEPAAMARLDDGDIDLPEPLEETIESGPHGEVVKGRLSYENRIADVLRRVLKTKSKNDAVLRLRSPSGTVDGSILIANRRFIAGATCEHGQVVGYAAVRKMLMLTAGEYSWSLLEPGEVCAIERNLNINLKALIPKLPFLPDTLSDFFDEASLLDKIFHPKRWAELIDDSSLLDWVFSPSYPGAVEPEKSIRQPMPKLSRTWTTLKPIPLVNDDKDQPIKVPRHLREGILRGESLAHTVTRNFGTVGSVAYANARRLQRKKTSFSASRSAGPFMPAPTILIGLAIAVLAAFFWVNKGNHNEVSAKKKSAVKNERVSLRHQKSH